MKIMRTIFSLVLLCTSGLVTTSNAATCTIPATPDQFDNHYTPLWGCQQAFINDMWSRYDFDKGDWDSGFGYHDACNNAKPLKRTFNALQVLAYSVTPNPHCNSNVSNIGEWAYCWAGNQIDELDGRCGSGNASSGSRARTQFGPIIDNWTRLYWPFFYGESVVQRAGTIFHEARHAHGWCNHGGSCPRGSSCDKSWNDGCFGVGSGSGAGANTYQVLWLNWFATTARSGWINSTIRANAVAEANSILSRAYQNDPCFRMNSSGFFISSC